MKIFQKLTLAIFAATLSFMASTGYAQDSGYNPYSIEDVEVSVVAKTPSDAKNLATVTARRDAFLILLTRLSVDSKIFARVTDQEIVDMVRSEQVFDEKIAGTNYSGRYNIIFAKDFVDYVLTQKNYKQVAVSEDTEVKGAYLLIPIKVLKKKTLIWEDGNDWRKFLAKSFKTNKNDDFKIPDVSVSDVSILSAEAINQISSSDLDIIFTKYKAEMLYAVSYSYDDLESKAVVMIRGYNKYSDKKQWKLSFINSNNLDEEDLLKIVASKTADYLVNLSKSAKQELNPQVMSIEAQINRLDDWLTIKDKIERSGLVDKMDIEAVSRDYVKIAVNYVDSRVDPYNAFAQMGFVLLKKTDGTYLLKTH